MAPFPDRTFSPKPRERESSGYSSSSPSTPFQEDRDLFQTPTTRSRTLLFLSVRSSFSHPSSSSRPYGGGRSSYDAADDDEEDESAGLMGRTASRDKGKGRETRVDMGAGLPPVWVDTSDSVNALLSGINIKVATLDKLHAKHVLPGFKDRSAEEREIEAVTASVTRDFRQAQNLIKRIRPSTGTPTRAELVSASNVQRGLAGKVQDLSGAFRRKQRVYMQKLQGHAIKNADLLIASGAVTLPSSSTEAQEALEEDLQASQYQLQSQLSTSNPLDSQINQRSQELSSIAQSITELADLFRDLGDMVVEQGTLLDSVEYNIEVVGREMKGAVEELEQATTYQKNTGRRKCIFLLMLICVGLVIVLIYKPRSHSSPSTPPPTPPIPIPTTVKVAGRCKIAMPRFQVVDEGEQDPWARSRTQETKKRMRARRRRSVAP
ncbi:t-SNARE [Mrakia frigida]|uniref:t-SNARE syntaxin TLG2 n=1 Tax=Mrakia frigida TaxID=29902 RepID=UPI003FCBFDF2